MLLIVVWFSDGSSVAVSHAFPTPQACIAAAEKSQGPLRDDPSVTNAKFGCLAISNDDTAIKS